MIGRGGYRVVWVPPATWLEPNGRRQTRPAHLAAYAWPPRTRAACGTSDRRHAPPPRRRRGARA